MGKMKVVTELRQLCQCRNQTKNEYGIQQLQE